MEWFRQQPGEFRRKADRPFAKALRVKGSACRTKFRKKTSRGNVRMIPASTITDVSLVAQAQPANPWLGFVPIILIMVIFYVLLFLPAQRRQKKLTEMIANLKSGDKVVTNGGIYGTIVGLENEAVQLRIADQVRIKVARSAIAGMQPESSEG